MRHSSLLVPAKTTVLFRILHSVNTIQPLLWDHRTFRSLAIYDQPLHYELTVLNQTQVNNWLFHLEHLMPCLQHFDVVFLTFWLFTGIDQKRYALFWLQQVKTDSLKYLRNNYITLLHSLCLRQKLRESIAIQNALHFDEVRNQRHSFFLLLRWCNSRQVYWY